MTIYEQLFSRLAAAGVRFVVVGGVAVVMHGYPRLTADVDLVVDLSETNARGAIEVLGSMGYKPTLSVDPAGFADEATRRAWIEERNLQVFSMHDPTNPLLTVDLFAKEPLPFEELWSRARIFAIGGHDVRIASIADLITMKRVAGRAQDQIDIEKLEAMRGQE